MTTHYDNSGSEDGQLRSPGDDQYISGDDELDEHDGDSLDIKPPQATTHYSRDAAAREPKRREKLSKEKKHSRERRQHRDKSATIGSSGGGSDGGHERERERERKVVGAAYREGRNEIDRYQHQQQQQQQQRGVGGSGGGGGGGGGYERNDGGRYQKHYDRGRDNHALVHHHNQQPVPMHMHRRQQEFFERPNDYHHHHGNDYHSMRQNYNNKHYGQRVDYGHDMSEPVAASNMQRERERDREREKERERRKYSNSDGQQDAESLEQDLRSRLLSKRHKYVKEYEPTTTRKHHVELQAVHIYEEKERNERNYEEAHKERHSKSRRTKDSRSKVVIEVFDSPDFTDLTYDKTTAHSQQHSKKHKRRDKDSKSLSEAPPAAANVVEKHRSPEVLEQEARRSKFLVAEREKTKRKEKARGELEARREKKRDRGATEIIDELSPTAVAATVTAGLSALVKRHKSVTIDKRKKQSKKHKSKQHSDYEEGEHEEQHDEDDDDDDDDDDEKDNEYIESETDEQSEAESEHHAKMSKKRKNSLETLQHIKRKKLKNSKRHNDEPLTDDEDVQMAKETTNSNSDSEAASERNYKKSKTKRKHSKKSADQDKKHRRNKKQAAKEADDDDGDEVLKLPDSPLSIGELSKSPEKRRGRTKTLAGDDNDDDDEEEDDDADDDERTQSTRSRSHTRSNTESRSRSHTPHSSTHSSSRSRTRSRSRSLSHRRRRTISSSRSDSRSRSRSPHSRSSRSRSRTEERDMHANLRKSDAAEQQHQLVEADKRKTATSASSPTPCDDKGVPLPNYFPGLQGCRSVEEFQCLNRIEEGTYGVVYRAKDKRTHEIVALKRLKMEKEKEGFPITSLREINTLLKGQHPNIVTVREIVVGSNMDKIFIVMDYVEHDLKSLMETMKTRKQCFLPGEVKCLTQQLLSAVGHLHDNWILHRDLKTSNLLLSHKGILKVGDFGLAREYGSPLKKYTSLVVTLWYRAPELLLCSPEYSTPIDIWSVGCIFAEFLQMAPLFPGKSEIDELNRIFKELGTPNDKIWPGYKDLPAVKNLLSQNSQFADYPVSNLRKRFHEKATETGINLLHGLLTYDPKQRLTADAALKHAYFKELPLPIDPSMFPTWPAKSELGVRKALASSPKPPSGGSQFKQLGRDEPITNTSSAANKSNSSTGFSGIITGNKKTSANTGFVLNAGIEQRQVAMGPGFNLKF